MNDRPAWSTLIQCHEDEFDDPTPQIDPSRYVFPHEQDEAFGEDDESTDHKPMDSDQSPHDEEFEVEDDEDEEGS